MSTLLEYITNNPPVPFSPVPACAFSKPFCPPIPPGFPAPPPANLVAHDELALYPLPLPPFPPVELPSSAWMVKPLF